MVDLDDHAPLLISPGLLVQVIRLVTVIGLSVEPLVDLAFDGVDELVGLIL